MKINRVTAAFLASLALAIASPSFAQDMVVKIGHGGPLSGGMANSGKDNENGVRLAIDELNASDFKIGDKRVKFELVSEDDQGDPKAGVTVAQKLSDVGVKAVIGHYNSGVSIPAARIYNQAGIPMITGASSNPKLTQMGYDNVFRLAANDNTMGAAMAEFAFKRGFKRVAVIDDRTAYGTGVADIFAQTAKKLGMVVTNREYTTDKATDFTSILTIIRGQKVDAIFYGGYYAQAGLMSRQMKQLDVKGTMLGGDGICTTEVVALGASELDGHYFCAQGGKSLDSLKGGAAFREKFKKTFSANVDAYAPAFYVATLTVARAMQVAGSTDSSKVIAALKQTSTDTLLGPVKFDATGEWVGAPVTLYQVANGKLSALQ